MQRIVLCWELGKGYGHIAKLRAFALGLRKRGHEVVFVLKDLFHADRLQENDGFPVVQAPIWQHRYAGLPQPVSYAEILFRFGYHDTEKLHAIVSAWRSLFTVLQPSLLVVNHGPTALLAARGLGIPTAVVGTGFELPPRENPLPNFRTWEKLHPRRLASSDQRVLNTANQVLRRLAGPEMASLSDLFDVDGYFLCTLPELEHYAKRGPARYWGPLFERNAGEECSWPPGQGARVFLYVTPGYAGIDALLSQLERSPHRVILHAPGWSPRNRKRALPQHIMWSNQPVKLRTVANECDLAICHGGHGTVAGILLGGKPLIMLPLHLEHQLMALRVTKLGAGLALFPEEEIHLNDRIERLLTEPGFGEGARAFARQYADFDEEILVQQLVGELETLLNR